MAEFNRFDVCEAYYLYMVLYHAGQGSKEYRLTGTFAALRFETSPLMRGPEDLSENGREIFERLVSGERTIRDRR